MAKTTWLFGYDPALASFAQTPNGLAMVKSLFSGEVGVLLVPVKQMVDALKVLKGVDKFTLEEIDEALGSLQSPDFVAMKDSGCTFSHTVWKAGEVFYVPPGWYI